jgi:hypothetical protein
MMSWGSPNCHHEPPVAAEQRDRPVTVRRGRSDRDAEPEADRAVAAADEPAIRVLRVDERWQRPQRAPGVGDDDAVRGQLLAERR